MDTDPAVGVAPIAVADRGRVSRFLHLHLNNRLSASDWASSMTQAWEVEPPNYGFMLTRSHEVVGVNLAFYSTRVVAGVQTRFCNLGALCVVEDARHHTWRLLRAILRQPGYCFTDFSPSGNVVELDRRLGFRQIDTKTALLLNLAVARRHDGAVISEPAQFEAALSTEELAIYEDLRSSRAAHHVLLGRGGDHCYVIFRIDRRKRLRAFASLLYVSNPSLLADIWPVLKRHLLLRHRIPFTLAEGRLLESIPKVAVVRPGRPKMYKGSVKETDIDYLYSELTEVAW